MTIRIYLVDDHWILRQGLRAVLQDEQGLKVVGEAGDGIGVAPKIEATHADVVVLDLAMPGLNGLEVTRQIKQYCPKVHVVILSMRDKEAYIAEAFQLGACAYVLKGSSSNELVQAIHKVVRGEHYLDQSIDKQAIETYQRNLQEQSQDPFETLTKREREVALLVVHNLNSAEIAERLVISPRTVEKHRERILNKLNLKTSFELVRYILNHKLEGLDEDEI